MNYRLRGDIYQTNLGDIIPGGKILAGQVSGTINKPIGNSTDTNLNFNYSKEIKLEITLPNMNK